MLSCLPAMLAAGAESWPQVLAGMPLRMPVAQLNQTNCVSVMLESFGSNATVKALIFLPGATDELFFFRRVQANLTNRNPTLLDSVMALTNQSHLRVTFRAPFLLIHSAEDVLDLNITIESESTQAKLRSRTSPAHLLFVDRDWDAVRKVIKKSVRTTLWPGPHSRDSWDFYRHCFAAWNLTAWETLEATALAGKTRFIVRRGSVSFRTDSRIGALPQLDHFPR